MFIEAKDDGGGGDNWTTGAVSRAKLQSNHHQQTNIQFFTGQMPFLSPTNSVKALKGKISHSMDLLTQAHLGVFQLSLWPLIAPGYLGGEVAMPLISPMMPVSQIISDTNIHNPHAHPCCFVIFKWTRKIILFILRKRQMMTDFVKHLQSFYRPLHNRTQNILSYVALHDVQYAI